MKHYQSYALAACLILQISLCQAIDTIKVNEKDGLFTAFNNTSPIIKTNYIGWGDNWQWVNIVTDASHTSSYGTYRKTSFNGKIDALGIAFDGNVTPENGGLAWRYLWKKSKHLPDAIGAGINFNLQLGASPDNDPELLPNREGWKWKLSDNKTIQVTFYPAPDKVEFEQGQKSQIRVYLFSGVDKGNFKSTMTVSVNSSVKLSGPDSLAYAPFNKKTWHKDILSDHSSPIDLSFLNDANKPAGKKGFVIRKKDELFFANGEPAKFWGANVQAYALFKTPSFAIKSHAKRIAQLGFNLIRLHHHDSEWVKPNIFKKPSHDTQELSASALQKLDLWIKCLKDEGVYLWLDLHVGRIFTDKDGIDGFSDLSQGQSRHHARGFTYYNEDIQALMMAFNQAYLNHVNEYTRLAYKDDPAVMGLLITNENDVTHHYGNSLLGNKNVPLHHEIFDDSVTKFAKSKKLSKVKSEQTWKMGESKIYLNEVEHKFNQKMIGQLDKLGTKSLVATTNSWGETGLFSLPALSDGSIIDVHSYGKSEEFNLNPRYSPGFLAWIGAAQITGYPLSVTEWNIEPFPARDRFVAPIYTASIASLQGWDAMMLYGYSQDPLGAKGWGSNYSSYNDPAIIGLMPAAALLYRQGHVSLAKKSYELKLHRKDFFFSRQDPRSSKTVRTLLETSQLTIAMPDTPELPWLKANTIAPKKGTISVSNANKDFIPSGQKFVESDTGELKRDWSKGIHTINSDKSQVASGWIGGESIMLKHVSFKMDTKKAVVAVQSTNDLAINKSNHLFITVMARSQPEGSRALPFFSEPVIGKIRISAPAGLTLYPVNSKGIFENPIKVIRDKTGHYALNLSAKTPYHWYILQGGSPEYRLVSPLETEIYTEGDLIKFKTNSAQLGDAIKHVQYWKDSHVQYWHDGNSIKPKAKSAYYGDKLLKKLTKAPYEYSTSKLEAGAHTIYSKITYIDGKSEVTEMALAIKPAPFRILQPFNEEKIRAGQSILLTTNAEKWAGSIESVQFWKDQWKYLYSTTHPPYEYRIKSLPVGDHALRARVTHKNGSMVDSVITVTVEGGSTDTGEPAPFAILEPANKAKVTFGDPVTITTNASQWPRSIKSVEFWKDQWKYLNGARNAPYKYTVENLSRGKHILRSRLTYKDGTNVNATISIAVE